MLDVANSIFESLTSEVEKVKLEGKPLLEFTSEAIRICRQGVKQLDDELLRGTFPDADEEIIFFREIKPKIYSELIYYTSVFKVELNRPIGSIESLTKYFNKEILKITEFFYNNHELYRYIRSGSTDRDHLYFRRTDEVIYHDPENITLTIEPKLGTIYSYRVAQMIAYDKLDIYLKESLLNLSEGKTASHQLIKFKWTGPKVGLIELIYALHACKVINNGKADIKTLVTTCENLFEIKLGNFYNSFQEMRLRKKNRSVFLDELRDFLLKRMDEADEKEYK